MTRTAQTSSFLHRDAGFLFLSQVDWCLNQLWGLPSYAKEAEPYWGFMFQQEIVAVTTMQLELPSQYKE